jgi:hypothetical protein
MSNYIVLSSSKTVRVISNCKNSFHHEAVHDLTPTEDEKGGLLTPFFIFPRSRGKMKKGDRKDQVSSTAPQIAFSKERTKITKFADHNL